MLTFKDKIILSPLWLLGSLPLWMLQAFAWVLHWLIWHVLKYRKKVVLSNLRNAFPEKTESEIVKIAKRFYLHLCDIFMESIYRMSATEAQKRYVFEQVEVYQKLFQKGKDLIIMMGHYANWEWTASAWNQVPYRTIGVYKPLMNKTFDRYFIFMRTRFGSQAVPLRNTFKEAVGCRQNNDRFALLLVGDQRPTPAEIKLWLTFMNQDTPIILGPEKMAQKFDTAVIYLQVVPVKRGYYRVFPVLITENASKTAENEVSTLFYSVLENQIKSQPEYYLWSHKRWKYTKADVEKIMERARGKK